MYFAFLQRLLLNSITPIYSRVKEYNAMNLQVITYTSHLFSLKYIKYKAIKQFCLVTNSGNDPRFSSGIPI